MHRVILLVMATTACAASKPAPVRPDPADSASGPVQISVAPLASGDLGESAPLELTFRNVSSSPRIISVPDESHLEISARDGEGHTVACRPPAATIAEAQIELQAGERYAFKIDVLKRCAFVSAGKYALEVRYVLPNGSPPAMSKTTLVLAAKSIPWSNPGPLSPGQSPHPPGQPSPDRRP